MSRQPVGADPLTSTGRADVPANSPELRLNSSVYGTRKGRARLKRHCIVARRILCFASVRGNVDWLKRFFAYCSAGVRDSRNLQRLAVLKAASAGGTGDASQVPAPYHRYPAAFGATVRAAFSAAGVQLFAARADRAATDGADQSHAQPGGCRVG